MKTYRFLGILVAAVVLPLAGCDNVVDEVPDAGNDQKVVVKFTGGWGDGPARTTWERTDNGFTVKWKGKNDNPSDYDKVGIYVKKGSDTVEKFNNVCYHPTTNEASSPLEIDQGQETALEAGAAYDFYSYFPYYNNGEDKFTEGKKNIESIFSSQTQLGPDNSDHLPNYDLMFAECKGITIQNGVIPSSVDFTYKHLLTCLEIRIKSVRTNKACQITKLRLTGAKGKNNILPGSFNTNTGEVSASNNKVISLSIPEGNWKDLNRNETQRFWVMVYPKQSAAVTLGVYFSEEGITNKTLSMNFPSDMQPGVNYIINLKLGNSSLEYDN